VRLDRDGDLPRGGGRLRPVVGDQGVAADPEAQRQHDGAAGDGGAAGVAEGEEPVLNRPEHAGAQRQREVLEDLRRASLRTRVDRGQIVIHQVRPLLSHRKLASAN
jgi:hypothetical protein